MTTQEKVLAAAARYGIPSDLLLRLAGQESSYNQAAVSNKGAIGVMQLMPSTAAGLGVDPNNEDQNIDGGARYLRQLYDRFGDWQFAVAAYNAGPGRISDVLSGLKTLPAETANYVLKIIGRPFGLDVPEQIAGPGTFNAVVPAVVSGTVVLAACAAILGGAWLLLKFAGAERS